MSVIVAAMRNCASESDLAQCTVSVLEYQMCGECKGILTVR